MRGKSGRVHRQEAEASPRRSTEKVAEAGSECDGEGSSVAGAAAAGAAAGGDTVVGFMDWGFFVCFLEMFCSGGDGFGFLGLTKAAKPQGR